MPFKANAACRRHIPQQRHRATNPAAYDAAPRRRGSVTAWFTEAAIAACRAEPRTTRGGQPRHSGLLRLALRQTEGLIGSTIALLGLNPAVPDHTTLSRRAETLQVPRPPSRRDNAPMHLPADGTGLKLCGAGGCMRSTGPRHVGMAHAAHRHGCRHDRCFGREQTIYNPWHYVPVLTRKPGAMRNGAPFKDWVLPGALGRVRQKLKGMPDGDRQIVKILAAVLTDSLPAVEAACSEALEAGLCSSDVVLNALSRQHQPDAPAPA